MKIAIYHRNLDIFGGGEIVALTIANVLSKKHNVDIFTHQKINKNDLIKFFNIDLNKINIKITGEFISSLPILKSVKQSMLLRNSYKKLEEYDLVVDTCTNGWFDKKLKTKTICYVHYPLFPKKKKGLKSLLNLLIIQPENAFKYDKIFCNSNFTKNIVSKMTKNKLEILYPPVEIENIKPRKKLKRIVTIGRFSCEKKHEVMIEAFKELYKGVKNYEFHLIGSFQEKSLSYNIKYFNDLKNRAKGYPIEFHINMPHNEVLKFLEESKIYWHARGYGETDLDEYENFGITTAEAMAAGCIPIVINLGAQPEIIKNGEDGYCWNNPKELLSITKKVIIKDDKNIIKNAIEDSKKYSKKNFEKRISGWVNEKLY